MEKFTQKKLLLLFKHFFKAWIYIILKEREIYPKESFTIKNMFNLTVPYNRSIELNKWIDELIEKIMSNFNHVLVIHLNIIDERMHVQECYNLDLKEFYRIDYKYLNNEITDDIKYTEVFDEFRSVIYSLMMKIRKLPGINGQDYSFLVTCETVKGSKMNNDWVLNDENDVISNDDKEIIPIKVIDIGSIIVYPSIDIYRQ